MTGILLRMLEITAVSSAIIVAVFLFRTLFAKRIKPVVMGLLWALVLLRLCLPFTLESPVHLPQIAPQIQQAEKPVQQQPASNEITDNIIPVVDYEPESAYVPDIEYDFTPQIDTHEVVPAVQTPASTIKIDWLEVTAYVWAAGAAAILLTALWKGASFGRIVKRYETHEHAERIADEIRSALNIRRNIPVRICGDITTPVLFGYFRPHILLPESCQNSDSDTLRCILTHELCHVKRRDILKGYIWLVAKAAHWFNPLVWLAYFACKDDIELSCDDMVLRYLGKDNRFTYTQSLIDVFRYYRRHLPLAVPLFESKPKLTERVIRMLKPCRRSKTAVALSVMLALVMLVAGFTTACSPAAQTAETTDPPQHTTQPEISAEPAAPSPVYTEAPQETDGTPLSDYKTTGHWTDSFEKEKSLVKINADADIVIPETSTFKTYKVNPGGYISQELADRMVKVFFGDTPVYKYSEPTKQSLQAELDKLVIIQQSMLDGTFDFSGSQDKQKTIDHIEEGIDELKDRIKEAPEATAPVPLDTTLVPNDFDGGWFVGVADLGEDEQALIHLSNQKEGAGVSFIYRGSYFGRDSEPYKAPIGNLTMTEVDAIKAANELMKELGINDYQLYSNSIAERIERYRPNTGEYAHVLVYTRVVDGTVISPNTTIPAIGSMDYNPESIRITIDNKGLREFEWKQRFDVIKTESAEVTLLPTDDIKKAIADQMFILYRNVPKMLNTDTGIPKAKTSEYILNIGEIRLEYAKIPCDGDMKNNRLIPVWNVYGTTEWRYSWEKDGKQVSESNIDKRQNILLTLSAIDGSMIDFSLAANKGKCP